MAHRKGKKVDDSGQPWTPSQDAIIRRLVKQNTPTPLIADALGRTPGAVYQRAATKRMSLRPTNKSPYERRKK